MPRDTTPAGRGDAIVVEALAKRYPNGTDAVRGVSFRVRTGEVFGILGRNGAGKSTTMGMLGTLVRPTGGRATVAGFDVVDHPREVRRRIGFAMQEVGVDELATATEAFLLIFLTTAYQTEEQVPSGVLRAVISANPTEYVLRAMRELTLSGFDWNTIGPAFLVIVALALIGLPLTIRNYRSVYG